MSQNASPDDVEQPQERHDPLIEERERTRIKLDAARTRIARLVEALHRANEARAAAEKRLFWATSELQGIKTSTGWALLQFLYRVRFALFPRGSVRDMVARRAMRSVRQALQVVKGPTAPSGIAAPAGPVETCRTVPIRSSIEHEHATIVCLPIVEWNFRFQRPQQLARRFARRGHEVVFVKHTFGRTSTVTPLEEGIEQLELPGTAGINPYRDRLSAGEAERMAEALLTHLASRRLPCFTCVVQLPFWAPLANLLRERGGCEIVYDCMDLHAGFASNTADALAGEQRLVAEADLVVVSSDRLQAQVAPRARRTALVRNGVDYEHFAAVPDRSVDPGQRCTIGYFGAIADWFDSGLVAAIARLRPAWRIVLIGDTWSADTAPLQSAENVTLAGERPYGDLPSLIADWHCCIIPFLHTPLTEATNPVKVYEMLAAGKPVVSVALPELESMRDAGLVAIAEGGSQFVAAIEAELRKDGEEARAARRAFARANTWELRQQAMARSIEAIRPLVSVVIVTFHNRALNELCLESVLHDTDYPSYEVIVVDNGSTDGTPQMLREVAARDPRVRLVLNPDNRGFAIANNQGAAIARGSILCFLNNDTVVHGAWLSTLVGHLRQHPRLGLVGPVTNAIDNEARIFVGYDDLAQMPEWADAHCLQHRGVLEEISMLAFFCVVAPRWTWRVVGPLDERFGVGMFEDDDYNRRVRDAEFEVRLAWDSFVHHWQKASFKLISEAEYLRVYRENQRLYLEKWDEALSGDDELSPLRRRASVSRGVVIFAPSVGWQIDLAQRPHHLARVLASEGYVVVFDCSNAADEVDVIREVEPRIYLYKDQASRLADLPRIILWTFSYNYDYRDHFRSGISVVYDWIDDLSVFPYDPARLAALHARALREADLVAAVARRLHALALIERPDALYLPNAVEEGRFDREPVPNPALFDVRVAALMAGGRPLAGYYGAFAEWFDYDLLRAVATRLCDWVFVLIGPDHDGSLARSRIAEQSNVHWLGPRPYTALPGYLHRFDVAMIPFRVNDITRATSPLKLYEYFAAGRAVVSTPLPECMAFEEVWIAPDAETFANALGAAREAGREAAFAARTRRIADRNTWRMRAREAMRVLTAGQPRGSPRPLASVGPGSSPLEGATIDERLSPAFLAHKPCLHGTCNVCGRRTRFFRDDPSLDRESLTCEHCRSTSRYRSIARGVLESVASLTGVRVSSLAALPVSGVSPRIRVYDTQVPFRFDASAYVIPEHLRRADWIELELSMFKPDRPRGAALGAGVTNQNLEHLTFADGSFDLVLTTDVMEHVRLDDRAHREIARVLTRGGHYVFTVPHFRDRHETLVRVRVVDPADPGRDEMLTEPEYHGDANAPDGRGALSYRSYGTDILEQLDALGFDVSYDFTDRPECGILNTELFHCVKR